GQRTGQVCPGEVQIDQGAVLCAQLRAQADEASPLCAAVGEGALTEIVDARTDGQWPPARADQRQAWDERPHLDPGLWRGAWYRVPEIAVVPGLASDGLELRSARHDPA